MKRIAIIGAAVIMAISGVVVYALHKDWIGRVKSKLFNRREYY